MSAADLGSAACRQMYVTRQFLVSKQQRKRKAGCPFCRGLRRVQTPFPPRLATQRPILSLCDDHCSLWFFAARRGVHERNDARVNAQTEPNVDRAAG
eukprot:3243869-Rhodomonas_salina.1